jgi:hypothetical protein
LQVIHYFYREVLRLQPEKRGEILDVGLTVKGQDAVGATRFDYTQQLRLRVEIDRRR